MAFRNTSILFNVAIIAQFLLLVTTALPIITMENTAEGPCVKVKSLTMEELDLSWALQFVTKAGFVPMGSELHYAVTTKMLTGELPKEWTEVNKMCPKVESGLFDSIVTGYGKRVKLACEIQGVGIVDCFLKNDPARMNSSSTITWSDNKKYMVTLSCLPGNLKSWNVVSTQPTVDEASRIQILNHIKSYGFNPDKTVFPTFETC